MTFVVIDKCIKCKYTDCVEVCPVDCFREGPNMLVERIEVQGDGAHFEAVIVSSEFQGKNTLARHRIVYAALGDKMKEAIHALSMKTLTKEEANKE